VFEKTLIVLTVFVCMGLAFLLTRDGVNRQNVTSWDVWRIVGLIIYGAWLGNVWKEL